jgi:muramoyltetrapeptide carboxypeptidase
MKILKPQALQKGDKIGIISPSEPIIYKKKFQRGIEALKKLGFRVVLGKNIFKEHGAYMAGTDKERAADLNAMFKNPEIKGIFCSTGGFNSNRLLDLIDYDAIKKNPKVFVGCSDITVLLNAIHKKTGLVAFHGHNVEHGFSLGFNGRQKRSREYFEKAMMTGEPIGPVKSWGKTEILKKGKAKGVLIGGNLSALMTLLGTEYEPDWREKILFWEETSQTSQDIDFHLIHLKLCGVFKKISGMIVGKLTKCDILRPDDDWKKEKALSIDQTIFEISRNYKFPIISGISFGHYYHSFHITIPIGVKATIDTSKKLFSIDELGVRN